MVQASLINYIVVVHSNSAVATAILHDFYGFKVSGCLRVAVPAQKLAPFVRLQGFLPSVYLYQV